MMNLTKILSAAVAFCVGVFPFCAFADTIVSDRGDVTATEVFDVSSYDEPAGLPSSVSENLRRLSAHAGVLCLKSDDDITDISSLDEDSINETAVYIGLADIAPDGGVSAQFRLPSKSGRYTLCFISPYYDNIYSSFDFVSKLYFEYNDALVGGEDAVTAFIEENLQYIPINNIGYSLLDQTQKSEIAQYLVQKGEVASEAEFNEVMSGIDIESRVFLSCGANEINEYIRLCRAASYGNFDSVCSDVYLTKLSEGARNVVIEEFVGKPFAAAQLEIFKYRVLCAYTDTFDNFAMMQSIADDGEQWGIASAALEKYRSLNDKNVVLSSAFASVRSVGSLAEFGRNFAFLTDEKYIAEHSGAAVSSSSGGGGGRGATVSVQPSAEEAYQPPKSDENNGNTDSNTRPLDATFSDMDGFDWAKTAVNKLAAQGIVGGKSDGVFAPSDEITREEFVKLITTALGMTGAEYESNFEDVSADDWFAPCVAAAVRSGFVSGVSLSKFGTGQSITRQDAAAIMHRIYVAQGYRINAVSDELPSDVGLIADYAVQAVSKLFSLGVINGYDGGEFRPNDTLTRAEAAVIIYRFFSPVGVVD